MKSENKSLVVKQ